MNAKRKIEIFSAGCPACEETIKLVNVNACPSCEISVLDVRDSAVSDRIKALGINSIPAVLVDGQLLQCCENKGPDIEKLKSAGLGQS